MFQQPRGNRVGGGGEVSMRRGGFCAKSPIAIPMDVSRVCARKNTMKWIDRAEARFGHLAIPGLIRVVAVFMILVYGIIKTNPHFAEVLDLDPARVEAGEVWRLVTYVFIPRWGAFLPEWFGAAMYVYFLWWIGGGLEDAMGPFKVNVFYFLGMIGTTAAAFFFGTNFSSFMLNSSLFFAFARFYPDVEIYLFFVLPVKIKWLAWVSGIFLLFGFVLGAWSYRAAVIAAMANYFVFFGFEIAHAAKHRQEVSSRRRRFEADRNEEALHRCAVCGRTELVAPDLEFRVSQDGQEYCVEHLPKPAARTPSENPAD
jgi:hypothetical protein